MSHVNLEHSLLYKPRITAGSQTHLRFVMTGTYVMPADSPGALILDPGASDRQVFLPSITAGAGQTYFIANVSTAAKNIEILSAEGSIVTVLEAGFGVQLLSFTGGWVTALTSVVGSGTATSIAFSPSGNISSTNVQSAIQELDTEKASIASLSSIAFSGVVADLGGMTSANRLLGRGSTAGSPVQEIALGAGLSMSGTTLNVTTAGGTVIGPALSIDNAIARWSGTAGTTLKNSLVTITDVGQLQVPLRLRFVDANPEIICDGDDGTVASTLTFKATGSGSFRFSNMVDEIWFEVGPNATSSIARYLNIIGTTAATDPGIIARGAGTDIGIQVWPKGAGQFFVKGSGGITNVLSANTAGTRVYSTTVSGSTSTGALVVDGGVGIAGALNVGGSVTFVSGQIKFPGTQVPSSDVNTLDDYEEGTFTPALTFGGASVGITYNSQAGIYTKVGNKVTFQLAFALTSKGSSTGSAIITGLPFTSINFTQSQVTAFMTNVVTTMGVYMATVPVSSTTIALTKLVSGTASAQTDADFTATTTVRISGSYVT